MSASEVRIPMRDGTKLYTVLIMPRGAGRFPIMLDRTPSPRTRGANRTLGPLPENVLLQPACSSHVQPSAAGRVESSLVGGVRLPLVVGLVLYGVALVYGPLTIIKPKVDHFH